MSEASRTLTSMLLLRSASFSSDARSEIVSCVVLTSEGGMAEIPSVIVGERGFEGESESEEDGRLVIWEGSRRRASLRGEGVRWEERAGQQGQQLAPLEAAQEGGAPADSVLARALRRTKTDFYQSWQGRRDGARPWFESGSAAATALAPVSRAKRLREGEDQLMRPRCCDRQAISREAVSLDQPAGC